MSKFYGSHLSKYGNKMVAKSIFIFLRKNLITYNSNDKYFSKPIFLFYDQRNEARDFIDIRLVKFLNKCNLNVIPVPNSLANLKGLLKMKYIKGVVLSGGNDIFYDNLKKELKK